MTSGESRIVVINFARDPCGRRPRRTDTFANFSGQPSRDRSGASSGSQSDTEVCLFSFIGLSHADDSASPVAHGPDDHHHPSVQKSDRDEPFFAVVAPIVLHRQRTPLEHLGGPRHVQTPTLERFPALRGVEDDSQGLHTITLLQKSGHGETSGKSGDSTSGNPTARPRHRPGAGRAPVTPVGGYGAFQAERAASTAAPEGGRKPWARSDASSAIRQWSTFSLRQV